jgi:hypothetical protein
MRKLHVCFPFTATYQLTSQTKAYMAEAAHRLPLAVASRLQALEARRMNPVLCTSMKSSSESGVKMSGVGRAL